jgi:hypothetical protein
MDGMLVKYHRISTGGRGEVSFSHMIKLPSPTSVIAEISLSTFDTASAAFGTPITAFAVFTACTTDGTNPPLPPSETFVQGSQRSDEHYLRNRGQQLRRRFCCQCVFLALCSKRQSVVHN